MRNIVTQDNFQNIFNDITNRFWDIPFDNSAFQTINFIIKSQGTPERAYRAAALRLQSRLNSLKEAKFSIRKDEVKVKQLEYKKKCSDDEFEKELIDIEIEEIESNKPYTSKLINDAIVECQLLYDFIQSCPIYTREEFENSEKDHFEKRLLLESNGVTGAIKSLHDMGVDLDASIGKDKLVYKEEADALQLR